MAFTRPTLSAIIERVRGDIKDALGLTAILRRSTEEAFARAIGGASHILHGHIRFVSRQLFPDQAEVQYLEAWGAIYQLERKVATFATITISGTGTDGNTIPIGTEFQRSDNVTYTTDFEATIASGVYTVDVTATVAGSNSNTNIGDSVTLVSPISGVDSGALVDAAVTEGEDVEADDSYRSRILSRIRTPPSGGTVNDYITYAREVAGVTRAWVLPNWRAAGYYGEGGVGISFVEDGEDPIIPSPAKVAEVQVNVNIRKPVTADALVFAPVANVVNLNISLKPNTQTVRDNVTAELEDLFSREGQVAGAVDPDQIASAVTYSGGLPLSKVNEAISIAEGEQDHRLNSPLVDIVSAPGQLITLGTITFGTLA